MVRYSDVDEFTPHERARLRRLLASVNLSEDDGRGVVEGSAKGGDVRLMPGVGPCGPGAVVLEHGDASEAALVLHRRSDGSELRVYVGEGVPTAEAPAGSLYVDLATWDRWVRAPDGSGRPWQRAR